MLFFADMLLLAAVFALGAAIAEIEVYSVGVHIGSGMAVMFSLWLVATPLAALFHTSDMEPRWLATAIDVLIAGFAAWLLAQLFARWFYTADTRQANLMALMVGIGQVLILLFWRWAVS